jgi:YidC/Oxa1 family membrane protein insertase
MDKKTISAVFLIILVILGYQLVILPRFAPPPPEPVAPPVQQTLPPATPLAETALPPAPLPAAPAAIPPATTITSPASEAALPEAAERLSISVERPLYTTALDTQRGGLHSWRLTDYRYSAKAKEAPGELVELFLPSAGPGVLGMAFTDSLSQSSFSAPFAAEETADGLVLRALDQFGLLITRTYRFNPESYDVEMDITLENKGQDPRNISWQVGIGPGLDLYRVTSGPDKPLPIAYVGGEIDKLKVKGAGQSQNVGRVDWVGIGDRYFLTALAGLEGQLTGFVRKNDASEFEVGLQADSMTVVPNQIVTYKLIAYMGPKEQDRLLSYDLGFDKSVSYGWFSWLALPFLTVLKFFYNYLQNWGLAILALTMLVKLALFPISQNMYRSMKKMQSIQPQIKALKSKYKDDSKGLQAETMALYKQYKVNPMAGCAPMVIQIPVFFALYRVLYNAIELRGASFLYIPDLSLKDPYYITPLLMGATMILQQRMSPTSADPKQAKMMMFMPIIFTAMFLNFSSGLVLYFLFSNVIAIGEQTLVRKWTSRSGGGAIAVVREKPSSKGKKKGK